MRKKSKRNERRERTAAEIRFLAQSDLCFFFYFSIINATKLSFRKYFWSKKKKSVGWGKERQNSARWIEEECAERTHWLRDQFFICIKFDSGSQVWWHFDFFVPLVAAIEWEEACGVPVRETKRDTSSSNRRQVWPFGPEPNFGSRRKFFRNARLHTHAYENVVITWETGAIKSAAAMEMGARRGRSVLIIFFSFFFCFRWRALGSFIRLCWAHVFLFHKIREKERLAAWCHRRALASRSGIRIRSGSVMISIEHSNG